MRAGCRPALWNCLFLSGPCWVPSTFQVSVVDRTFTASRHPAKIIPSLVTQSSAHLVCDHNTPEVVPLSLPGLIVDDQSCQEGPMVEPQSSWHAVSPARAWPSPPNRLTHEEHVRKLEEYLRDLQDMPELLSATIELKQEVSNIMAQLRERSL
ncbi:unnamed protein product [Durusdinium trenchii]|uniref:Uncharacterized protein n=1 Tax=Durusdinium trenchii TaxID=1381693 RepID=A0ABP0Q953_9DINO